MKTLHYLVFLLLSIQPLMHADENFIASVQSWIGQNATNLSIGLGTIAASWTGCWYMIKKNNQKQTSTNTCSCETKITATQEKVASLEEKFNSTYVQFESDFSNWAKDCDQKIKTHIDQSTKERVEGEIYKINSGLSDWQQDCNDQLKAQNIILEKVNAKNSEIYSFAETLALKEDRTEKLLIACETAKREIMFNIDRSKSLDEEAVTAIANNVYTERQSKSIKEFQQSSLVQKIMAQGYKPQHQTSMGVFADIVYNLFKKQEIESTSSVHISNLLAKKLLTTPAYNKSTLNKTQKDLFKMANDFKKDQRSSRS